MLPLETVSLFFLASVALALAPGPDNIFVLTQSALYGRKAGVLVTLGLCTGLIVHTLAVTLGVAAIFQTSELAFTVLKLVGASYLIYLAWGAMRAGASALPEDGEQIPLARLYSRGVIMNITNPKVAIFFLAFLPQFVDGTQGNVAVQMILLGAVFMLATFLVFGAVACFSGLVGNTLRESPRAQIIMNRVAATVFVGLALRLAMSSR